MRVKAVADELSVSIDTIKKLERTGAIPPAPRDHVGHRRYRPEDVEAIKRVLYQVVSPVVLDREPASVA
jgi:DNA-binding transcriptional MerR regulator